MILCVTLQLVGGGGGVTKCITERYLGGGGPKTMRNCIT